MFLGINMFLHKHQLYCYIKYQWIIRNFSPIYQLSDTPQFSKNTSFIFDILQNITYLFFNISHIQMMSSERQMPFALINYLYLKIKVACQFIQLPNIVLCKFLYNVIDYALLLNIFVQLSLQFFPGSVIILLGVWIYLDHCKLSQHRLSDIIMTRDALSCRW